MFSFAMIQAFSAMAAASTNYKQETQQSNNIPAGTWRGGEQDGQRVPAGTWRGGEQDGQRVPAGTWRDDTKQAENSTVCEQPAGLGLGLAFALAIESLFK